MKHFYRLVAGIALAGTVCLAGCAGELTKLQAAYADVTSSSVPLNDLVLARQTFNAVEVSATQYLGLKRCDGATVICRSPAATKIIVPAIRSGRVARINLATFMREHPGQLGPSGIYNALVAANSTLNGTLSCATQSPPLSTEALNACLAPYVGH